jgi:hypothetical protein
LTFFVKGFVKMPGELALMFLKEPSCLSCGCKLTEITFDMLLKYNTVCIHVGCLLNFIKLLDLT